MRPANRNSIAPADAAAKMRRDPAPGQHAARLTTWRAIADGAGDYRRERHLPRLLPLMPSEIADESASMRRRIVARLARALRAERTRGRAGHWTYDLNRHMALCQAYAAERRLLKAEPDGKDARFRR